MIGQYLKDLENVEGFQKKELPNGFAECPKCLGWGGWNLKLNAYGPGNHFKAFCGQCNGWGYVRKGSLDETCIHEMNRGKTIGRCLTLYTCKLCGREWEIDSSD